MKKKIYLVLVVSFAVAGYCFNQSRNNANVVVCNNVEALTAGDNYPSAAGYSYEAMYEKDPYSANQGIYMDVTTSGTQTETPYQMMDSQGHIAYKCSVYRKPVNSTVTGHCFEWK